MNNDRWLRELAQVNREREAEERSLLDERWDRLSAGELTPEEEAELRALAETSEDAREAYEAFRPLGPDFQARVVGKIQRRARVVPFPPRPAWLWKAAAATAAAAAALFLFVPPPAPLPDYRTSKVSGVQAMRGEQAEDAEIPSLAPGQFKVVLQPKTSVSRLPTLEARCFLVGGGDLRHLKVQKQEHDPGGSIRIEGTIGDEVRPGRWTLWSVVGRRGKLPEDAELRAVLAKDPIRQRDWVALPTEVRIRPEGSSP